MKILLIAFFTIFCMNNAQAQSHIANANYGCRLKPGSLNTEKDLCPACAASDKKEQVAKIAEEKRRFAEAQAAAKAKKEASEKERLEKVETDKNNAESGKVYINGNNSTYNNNSTEKNSFEQGLERGQQISEIATGLSDLFAPTPAQLQRQENAAKAAEDNAKLLADRKKTAESHFQTLYLNKYLSTAEAGNVTHRLTLILAAMYEYSFCYCDMSSMLPDREIWLKEAIKNDNLNAIAIVGNSAIYGNRNWGLGLTTTEGIKILEKAASDNIHLTRGSIGIIPKDISAEYAKSANLGNVEGESAYLVTRVIPNSAAELAGIQKGDVVEHFKKKPPYNINDEVEATYFRDGKKQVTKLVIKGSSIDPVRLDIMLILAKYYNFKNNNNWGGGGNDPSKALFWYSQAANNGSPSAMNKLGNIYLKGATKDWGDLSGGYIKSYFVKYDVKKDAKIAFEWFLKSVADPNYTTTRLQKLSKDGSYFIVDSYDELISMYTKGIGCEKSLEKANEFSRFKDELLLQKKLSK